MFFVPLPLKKFLQPGCVRTRGKEREAQMVGVPDHPPESSEETALI